MENRPTEGEKSGQGRGVKRAGDGGKGRERGGER